MYLPAGCGIAAVAGHLPQRTVTTEELFAPAARSVGRSDNFIRRMTGVQSIHVADASVEPSDLALPAIEQVLIESGRSAKAIDAVIYAGMCRDYEEPDTALIIAKKLGIAPPIAFDCPNACHGFATALMLADSLIKTGAAKRILICAGEKGAKRAEQATDYLAQRSNAHTEIGRTNANFTTGDAGAAAIVTRPHEGQIMLQGYSIVTVPDLALKSTIRSGVAPAFMDGAALKNATIEIVERELSTLLKLYECKKTDIAYYIPHQIGRVTISEYVKFLGIDKRRIVDTVTTAGNIVSCTLPIALTKILDVLSLGERIVFSIQGSGLTSSAWMAIKTKE